MTDGHPLYMVRLTDPSGGMTLFGIDRRSYAIRTMAFATPKGWHEQIYDDFVRLRHPDWLQPAIRPEGRADRRRAFRAATLKT